jgi:hypothetical protein
MATYQGQYIRPGTDAEIAAQIAAINAAMNSGSGGSTTTPSYGASGREEDPVEDAANKIFLENANKNTPTNYGYNTPFLTPSSTSGSGYMSTIVPTLSADESKGFAKSSGFSGLNLDNQFAGLTRAQASAKAAELKKKFQASTSQNTSYTYNPQSISGFNNKINELKLQLDSSNASPWINPQQKSENSQGMIKSYSGELAKFFNSQEELNAAMQDPNSQQALQKYLALGGNVADIASKIAPPQDPNNPQPDGSIPSPYQEEANGPQSVGDYLGSINDEYSQKALNDLIPEQQVAQAKIAFEQSIPEQYKELYFGSPEKVGLIQQQKAQAEEKIKLLERKAELDKTNAKAQIDLTTQKNNAEMDLEQHTIEENRMAAKNYMTGMLAKLGALNTTGAAPLALATLEQKYQFQSQKLRTTYNFANRQLQVDLNEKVGNIDLKRDEDILSTKSDLSKDEEDVYKEIFKLQNAADSKTFDIISKYTDSFMKQKEKYAKEARDLAEKDLKERQRILEKFDPNAFLKQYGMTDKRKKAGTGATATLKAAVSDVSAQFQDAKSDDGFVGYSIYQRAMDKFVNSGLGTVRDFMLKFPPKTWIDANQPSLPESLKRMVKMSSSEAKAMEEESTSSGLAEELQAIIDAQEDNE